MATILSLKELRSSSTLKTQLSELEAEKQQLLEQIEREKKIQQKLQDDILDQKKDFEHLEKQFEHFADIEADYEALQHEVQMERLEKMIDGDKKDTQHKNLVKKAKDDASEIQRELKELKKLDPLRLKRQVGDLKKKGMTQAAENKTINKALVTARKDLKEVTAEKDQLDKDYKASQTETDSFWQSSDGDWSLFETGLVLKEEEIEDDSEPKRIRCLNTLTGLSIVSKELGTEDKEKDFALWHGDIEVPEEVSKEAGKRLKNIASEAEDDDS
jgi:DNA repair exonuclease SbcCD ATPase subunit